MTTMISSDLSDPSILIIGGGPSAMYFLRWIASRLADGAKVKPKSIMVVESRPRFGRGWVYDEETVLPVHTLAANELKSRIGKGGELVGNFDTAVETLRAHGVDVLLRPGTTATDVRQDQQGLYCADLSSGETVTARYILLCTGHWEREPGDNNPIWRMCSPWPAPSLQAKIPASANVLLVGTSHTAVDAAFSIALAHGDLERSNGQLVYKPHKPAAMPTLTLASRGGYLPRVSGFGITTGTEDPEAVQKYRKSLTKENLAEMVRDGHGWLNLQEVFRRLVGETPFARTLAARWSVPEGTAQFHKVIPELGARLCRADGLRFFVHDMEMARRSITAQRHIPWQSVLWEKTDLFRVHLCHFPGEDRRQIDANETLLMAFQRSLNFKNAEILRALTDAGMVRILTLGHDYSMAMDQTGRINLVTRTSGNASQHYDFDIGVNCTGQHKHIEEASLPILKTLLKRGLIQPTLIPFRDPATAYTNGVSESPGSDIVTIGGAPYYKPGGIHINADTMEAIPKGITDRAYRGTTSGMFVLGPAMLGQYPISDGLHALYKVAAYAADEILERLPHSLAGAKSGLNENMLAG